MDFIQWWQHLPEHMDPVIFSLGSFRLQWYGLMYIIAFTTTYLLASHRIKKEKDFPYEDEFIKNLLTYAFLGVLIGGRLGYVVFYNLAYYAKHPLEIILPFQSSGGSIHFTGISGMSYHGGIIGVMVACAIFCKKHKANYWNLSDLFFPAAPLGYTFGRLGNFINGELWGRVTSAPIGMYFPAAPTLELRHPSQLYEAAFEGILLFFILWNLRKIKKPEGTMASLYLFGYGFIRFFLEFFRQPDAHLGFIIGPFSMGQILCVGMMTAGIVLFFILKHRETKKAGD